MTPRSLLAAIALSVLAAGPALAQQGVPNALQGFSQNRDKPVQIGAATLEVRDKDKIATFSGNVSVTQGDTTMRCKSLLVFYDQENKPGGMKAEKPGPGGQQAIRRLEARGGVVVTQKDQTATGDTGIFDMKSNTITLAGNVVVMQGQNVMRGEKLIVDMTSGAARVESGKGPVRALIVPGSGDKSGDGKTGKEQSRDGKDAERAATRERAKPIHPTGVY